MGEEQPRPRPAPCAQCGGAPFAGYDTGGGHVVNLCFEHSQQYEALQLRKMQFYQEMADRAEDNIYDTVGLPRPPRPPRIVSAPPVNVNAPRVNVNQIHIHGNNLGVVNTGTVGSIANHLTQITNQDPTLAQAFKDLTEGIIASPELTPQQKQEAADLLNEVTEKEAKPPTQRRSKTAMKAIATGLGHVLANAANLAKIWEAIGPHIST
jgi:hypothetical protein